MRVPYAEDESLLGVAEPLADRRHRARPARRLRYAGARLGGKEGCLVDICLSNEWKQTVDEIVCRNKTKC